jgi:alpha-N-arabinofuranosidase
MPTNTTTPTHVVLHPAFTVAPVNRRTFGAFVEHMGRCVYEGIFEPSHPSADERGLRTDVLALVRELGVSTVRYPGGNFVSGYRWEDGVGPREQRPTRRDLAWHSTETNAFGTDEFMAWCEAAGVEPMMAVNLGTRGEQEALDLLEYCTGRPGTALADLRAQNGHPDPYPVEMWCLGNEMDGPWQIGHKTAREYGALAGRTARAMHMTSTAEKDPESGRDEVGARLELVVCGTSIADMDTFVTWEREVLEECFDGVDMISAHSYYGYDADDLPGYLRSAQKMDRQIEHVIAACDQVAAAKKDPKRIMISFDEWNVAHGVPETQTEVEAAYRADPWPVAPPISQSRYAVVDAVVLGNLLISLLRHSDRVASASLAQLVNVLAPIRTEADGRAWKQTIFHPFALTSTFARGTVLDLRLPDASADDAAGADDALDAVATWDQDSGDLAVFVVNRDVEGSRTFTADVSAFGPLAVEDAQLIHDQDPHALGGPDDPEVGAPHPLDAVHVQDGTLSCELPAVSWAMLRLHRA